MDKIYIVSIDNDNNLDHVSFELDGTDLHLVYMHVKLKQNCKVFVNYSFDSTSRMNQYH